MKVIVGITVAMLVLVGARATAEACICGRTTICDAYWSADVVFIGRATNVKLLKQGSFHIEYVNGKPVTVIDGAGTESVTFVVEKTLRGTVSPTQPVKGTTGCGSIEIIDGERYLVYANLENGEYVMQPCSETKQIALAHEDLLFVRSLPSKQLATINGLVDMKGAPPAASVTIALRGSKTRMKTDRHGYFTIDVPTGTSTIELADPTVRAAPVTVAMPTKGMCKLASIDARWAGVARGRIADHEGTAAANMNVVAEYTGDFDASSARTGPDGRFELVGLKPGMPFTISTETGPNADHPYPKMFLPELPARTKARSVTLPATGMLDGLDFALPAPLPIHSSTVIVLGPRGVVANAKVKLREGYRTAELTTDRKGRATFRHVKGTIRLEACTVFRGREACGTVERALDKPTTLNLRI